MKNTYIVLALLSCVSMLSAQSVSNPHFKLGIENIPNDLITWLSSHRVGLIMNQTSITQHGKRSVDLLVEHGIRPVALFAPEHGIAGTTAASHDIKNSIDALTKIPIYSLYELGSGKKITSEIADSLDVFIFDIQDSGMRHYTYISTLYRILEQAAQLNKHVVVLDRPNPLGGTMEGPLVEPELHSFISIAPIPVRHGMTIAELARYFNQHVLKTPAPLRTVSMHGYERSLGLPDHIQPKLSPNIAHRNACYGYSFLGLLGEVRPFDVGIGSDKAFQCLLLPESLKIPKEHWLTLSKKLSTHNIKSRLFSHFSERKKKQFNGLHFTFDDIHTTESWAAFITVLQFFKDIGIKFEYSPTFDKAVGTLQVRNFLENSLSHAALKQTIDYGIQQFASKAQSAFLY